MTEGASVGLFPTEADRQMSASESPMRPAKTEDYIVMLLEQLIRFNTVTEGPPTQQMICREFDIISGAEQIVAADIKHDSWLVYFRVDTNVTLRVWPGGTPPASGAIEIRNATGCRIQSTSNQLNVVNIGSTTAHVFVFALNRADVQFETLT